MIRVFSRPRPYAPTIGMLALLRQARGRPVIDGDELYACRRSGLVASDGLLTDAGLAILAAFGAEDPAHG